MESEKEVVQQVLDLLTKQSPDDPEQNKWYWYELSTHVKQKQNVSVVPSLYEIGLAIAKERNLL
jgi:hypothetical protein